jgi:hypothetical protein
MSTLQSDFFYKKTLIYKNTYVIGPSVVYKKKNEYHETYELYQLVDSNKQKIGSILKSENTPFIIALTSHEYFELAISPSEISVFNSGNIFKRYTEKKEIDLIMYYLYNDSELVPKNIVEK